MALFKRDWNKPGPGVPKNAPRKKGFARFFEIIGRDISNLVKLNIFYLPFAILPLLALFAAFIAMGGGGGLLFLLFCALGLALSVPLGGATVAMYHCISKMLRDDPGFIWHDFKKILKENFRSALVPGLIYAAVIGCQTMAFWYYQSLEGGVGLVLMGVYLFSVLLVAMAAPYYFLQTGYLTARPTELMRNSLLLAVGFAPRSLMSAILGTGLVIAQILFFPLTLPVIIIFGFTLPCLLSLMWIWPPVNKQFKIEETLVKRAKGEPEDTADAAEEQAPPEEDAAQPEDEDIGWEDLDLGSSKNAKEDK